MNKLRIMFLGLAIPALLMSCDLASERSYLDLRDQLIDEKWNDLDLLEDFQGFIEDLKSDFCSGGTPPAGC